jgi:hypothetical protein
MRHLKLITSHVGFGDFLRQTEDVGYIPRKVEIPSPFAHSSTHIVMKWDGKHVIAVETAHKRYDVYEVNQTIFKTEEAAEHAGMGSL